MPRPAASRHDEQNALSEECAGELAPEPLVLTARDWEAFLAAWDDVDRPRPQLEALIQGYRSSRRPDAG
jgi:hypothetical protein